MRRSRARWLLGHFTCVWACCGVVLGARGVLRRVHLDAGDILLGYVASSSSLTKELMALKA